MAELNKTYDPAAVEDKWYGVWEARGYFHADETRPGPRFSIVIPPPNVTGVLTMGHVLNNTLQDILVRFKRMDGYVTLWMPGTDHAGIATQNVVEKQLAKRGHSPATTSAARSSSNASGRGRSEYGSTILPPAASSSAPRATGGASASPWTRACRRRCARSSSASTRRA